MAFKHTLGALVLAVALPAGAQAPAPTPAQRPAAQRPAAQQPAAQQPAAQPQAQGQAPLSQEQLAAFGAVWMITQHLAGFGDAAASHGSTGEVANLCRTMGDQNKQFTSQLATLMQARGANMSALPIPAAERQRIEQASKDIQAKQGDEFDRAVISHMKELGPYYVSSFKRARDVTPGKDAELKKTLDQIEDANEGYLNKARQLDSQRAQARKPPAR